MGISTDYTLELTHTSRKRIHNLKYFTWVEQQCREVEGLDAQWYDFPDYWTRIQNQVEQIDELIQNFNRKTGLN